MNKQRKKLLVLIEEFKVPLPPEEAEKVVGKLSDGEVKDLVMIYSRLQERQRANEKLARQANSKAMEKIDQEYEEKIAQVDEAYLKELEAIQEETDDKLDSLEKETGGKLKKLVGRLELIIAEVEKLHRGFWAKVEAAATNKSS